jgi:hypothetical protein
MRITFPEREQDTAELSIDGTRTVYLLPPATGTHSECFADSNYLKGVRRATGKEIAAYAYGALVYRKNKWENQDMIRFPSINYLRIPKVLTIVPKDKKFGDLEGALIVDEDLNGEGIAMKTEVPADLNGWKASEGEIFERDGRIVVPYEKWYEEQWNGNNGAAIAIFDGQDSVASLDKTAKDSKRNYKPLWKVDPTKIKDPERRVPIVYGYIDGRLGLVCNGSGIDWIGCAARVLE